MTTTRTITIHTNSDDRVTPDFEDRAETRGPKHGGSHTIELLLEADRGFTNAAAQMRKLKSSTQTVPIFRFANLMTMRLHEGAY